jgi:CMP-N-acetylneuraminic acid synthetase
MGSQRLRQKNLQTVGGMPLITRAIRKCKVAGVFDEIWVNSEHPKFGEIAEKESVRFHRRPKELASNTATSEDFVYEFLQNHLCDIIVQVHSIAPLLTTDQVAGFVRFMVGSDSDVLLSVVDEQIECAYMDEPINFEFASKTNSQELKPVQRITWSITGWRRETYVTAYEAGKCATYAGQVGFYAIDRLGGHIIKTEEDLRIANALWPLVADEV